MQTNHFLITLGNGADPEVFGHPCGANARSLKLTNNTGEEVQLDCTDPLGVQAHIARWTESQDTQMTISGRIRTESFPTWRAWADSGDAKNIRIRVADTVALGGGYYAVPAILQDFELSSEGKSNIAFTATIVGAAPREWVAAS